MINHRSPMLQLSELRQVAIRALHRGDLIAPSSGDHIIPLRGRPLKHPLGPRVPRVLYQQYFGPHRRPDRKYYAGIDRGTLGTDDYYDNHARYFLGHHQNTTYMRKAYCRDNRLAITLLHNKIRRHLCLLRKHSPGAA